MVFDLDPEDIVLGKTKIFSPQMNRLNMLMSRTEIRYSVKEGFLGGESMDVYDDNAGGISILNVISDGYGRENGLLEAQGLGWDSQGDLTAEEVFERICAYFSNKDR